MHKSFVDFYVTNCTFKTIFCSTSIWKEGIKFCAVQVPGETELMTKALKHQN